MSPRRRLIVVIALAFVAFVVAATGHGRQLRHERETHGHLQMDPVAGWPAPMHAIWQADRASLRTATAAAAVVTVGAAIATGGGLARAGLALLLWAPTLGFVVAAAASALRLRAADAAVTTAPAMALLVSALLGLVGAVLLGRARPSSPRA